MASSVPIDLSWDTEPCESYNPQEYVNNNLILQKPPPKLSKRAKKAFREQQRVKFQKIQENNIKEVQTVQMSCPSTSVMLQHMEGEKLLREFSDVELKMLSVDYMINYVQPIELLDVWGRLPESYKSNLGLQESLPCFYHYTKTRTQWDGPPPSQKKCLFCNNIFR